MRHPSHARPTSPRKALVFLCAGILALNPALYADSIDWINGQATENWLDSENWSSDSAPGFADIALIAGNYTVGTFSNDPGVDFIAGAGGPIASAPQGEPLEVPSLYIGTAISSGTLTPGYEGDVGNTTVLSNAGNIDIESGSLRIEL